MRAALDTRAVRNVWNDGQARTLSKSACSPPLSDAIEIRYPAPPFVETYLSLQVIAVVMLTTLAGLD
jgi:hypothetical protein